MKGMLKYAFKNRKIKENYLRKYSDRNSGRKAFEASRSNSLLRRKKEEVNAEIPIYGSVVLKEERSEYSSLLLTEEDVNEIIREEDVSEAHQKGR